jgi:hypothetical protein
MKRIALATIGLAAAVGGAGYVAHVSHPDEFNQTTAAAAKAFLRVWQSIEANPLPVAVALGTFVLTVIYHKLKGKSLRESVEVAATRVTVINAPGHAATPEPTVVARAKARTTRMQLLSDQIGLQNKQKWLPEAITNAEKDAAYTEQALADAERSVAAKQKAHDDAVAKLAKLRTQKAAGELELAEIDAELQKLAQLV